MCSFSIHIYRFARYSYASLLAWRRDEFRDTFEFTTVVLKHAVYTLILLKIRASNTAYLIILRYDA